MLLIWILFSNIGIILYKDKFGYCKEIMEFHISKEQCPHEEWKIFKLNFQNGLESMVTLFTVSTLDLWGEIY